MLQLVADANTLELDDPDAGYVFVNIDFGGPDIREVVNDRPNADGTTDNTAFVGARAIAVTLELLEGPSPKQTLLDQLARFLHPKTRIDLHHASSIDGPIRRIRVRANGVTALRERDDFWPCSVAFKTVGAPYLQSVDVKQVILSPAGVASVGFVFPVTFPLSIDPLMSSTVLVHNDGDQPAQWTVRIDGPVSGPRIRNETLGVELSFPTLTIPAGSYLEVSSEDRTVMLNGVTSRYSTLDFMHSTWWLLEPGATAISLPAAMSDVPAQGSITFYDTFLM